MNVRQILAKWADYNVAVNGDLEKILAPLASGASPQWEVPTGSFFKTAKALVSHIAGSDIAWLRRFYDNGLAPELKTIVPNLPENQAGKLLFATWDEYAALRRRLDEAWKIFVASVPEEKLAENFTYVNFQGKSITAPWIGLILHLLNHHTHHRGALSQILDEWGVENDYSGMNRVWML